MDFSKLKRIPNAYHWTSQVVQYPEFGEAGIRYFKGDVGRGKFVDCLLMRSKEGRVIGILNHYPFDFPPLEQKGNVNIWVHPKFTRQGIGTALLIEALKRYSDITIEQQSYTPDGLKFLQSFLNTPHEHK